MNVIIQNNFYASFTSIGFIIGKLKEELIKYGFASERINEVCLVVDEMVSNIIKYAYNKDKNRVFFFEALLINNNTIQLTFEDDGPQFDLLQYIKTPNYDVPIEDLPIGGLGIKFVKEVSSHISYTFTPKKKNRIIVEKKIK